MNKVALAKSLRKIGIEKVEKKDKAKVVAKLGLLKELEKMGIKVEAGKVRKSDIRRALRAVASDDKVVTKYELTDWKYDHPDYFQGMGVSGTEFDDVFVGDGDTAMDAAAEALNQATESGVKLSDEMLKDIESEIAEIGQTDESEGEQRYYVGLRVKY